MGQAKKRGTYEERKAQAIARLHEAVIPKQPIPPVEAPAAPQPPVAHPGRRHNLEMAALAAAVCAVNRY